MKKLLATILSITIVTCVNAGEFFNMPDGWVESASRKIDEEKLVTLEQYSTADLEIQVSVIKSPPVKSKQDKINSIAGSIKGMENKGFKLEFAKSSNFRGYDSIHARGVFNIVGYDGVFLADTHMIFTDDATITFAASVAESRGGREISLDLLQRLKLDEAKITDEEPIKISESKIWLYVGIFILIMALSAVACFLTNRRKKIS